MMMLKTDLLAPRSPKMNYSWNRSCQCWLVLVVFVLAGCGDEPTGRHHDVQSPTHSPITINQNGSGPCDLRNMEGYATCSHLAKQIAQGDEWDLKNDTAALALLDSLFSNNAQRFYMSVVERTMEKADGYYSEALGVATKRFFEERTCALARCCWENGCGDEKDIRAWARTISSEFLIDGENDPLAVFQNWSRLVRSRAKEQCDIAGVQRTDEILLAIKENLAHSMSSVVQ